MLRLHCGLWNSKTVNEYEQPPAGLFYWVLAMMDDLSRASALWTLDDWPSVDSIGGWRMRGRKTETHYSMRPVRMVASGAQVYLVDNRFLLTVV